MLFSLSITDFFLTTGLASALLIMSGNLTVETLSLELYIINSQKISRFALIIFTGKSFCWMALDASSESISLSTSSTSTAVKLKYPWWFSFISIILGWFWSLKVW